MILDSHNCGWIMQYPHQLLAGGGMYAIRLPSALPREGSAAGPPLPAARRTFLNAPMDMRLMFHELVDHPDRMQKTMDDMMAAWKKALAPVAGHLAAGLLQAAHDLRGSDRGRLGSV